MPYIGNNQVAGVHQNNFKILDDISSYTETFDGSSSSVVDTTNNTITVTQSQHRFYHGQRVTYNNGGGSNIGGLTSGTVYYAVADSHAKIKLAASLADALSNTVININSVGSGSSHTLKSSFDGESKKFKLTHSGGINVNLTNASHATIAINNVIQRPNLNDSSFTEGFSIEGGNVIVFKTSPLSTDTFWGNTIAEAVSTFDSTDHIIDTFTADGVATNFTLSKDPLSIRDIHITLDGVTQHTNAFSLQGNVLIFSTAPANGTAIQVKHMGFAGATSSSVIGFYGRTGNVALQDGDVLRGDGSLISGIDSGIPGISTTGTSTFNSLNVTGVSTFSNPVSIAATTHFASQQTFFGPVLGSGEISIDILDNTIAATFDYNDTSGLGLFLRSASDMYLLADHKTNTSSNGDGYGLIIQSGSGNIIPSHDYKPQLGLSNREFGTLFSEQLNISGVSTFANVDINQGSIDGTNIGFSHRANALFNYVDIANDVDIDDTTQSTNTTTGALKVDGGVGIVKNLNVGGDLDIDGHTNLDNVSIAGVSTFSGYLNAASRLYFDMGTGTKYMFGSGVDLLTSISSEGDWKLTLNASGGTGGNFIVEKSSGTSLLEAKGTGAVDINGTLSAANYAGLKVEQGYATNSSLSGTFNYEFANGHVQTYMSATSGNYTPNFRVDSSTTLASKMNTGGNSGVGDSVSATLFVASSSHYCGSSVQVDGTTTNVTTQWVGGSAPSAANGSGYDIYSFTIIKTASTPAYTVFANAISAA